MTRDATQATQTLQSVFAHRFNRFRNESGRLFQGRFKSVAVEDSGRLGVTAFTVIVENMVTGIVGVFHRWLMADVAS